MMTFETLIDDLSDLIQIAKNDYDSEAGKLATKILKQDVTTHNVEEMQKLLKSYYRNR